MNITENKRQKTDPGDMTYRELAEKVGINEIYAWYILKGRRRPGPEVARALEQITGIPAPAWIWPERYHNEAIQNFPKKNAQG